MKALLPTTLLALLLTGLAALSEKPADHASAVSPPAAAGYTAPQPAASAPAGVPDATALGNAAPDELPG
jgi:hypothetical protein